MQFKLQALNMSAFCFRVVEVDKEDIRNGDAIEHNSVIQTVSRSDIRRNNFTGLTIFGDSYMLGRQKVKKVVYEKQ